MGEFLKHLQIYKSTADVKRGEPYFRKYLQVDSEMLKFRDIVMSNKKPRRIEVQPEVELVGDTVEYR